MHDTRVCLLFFLNTAFNFHIIILYNSFFKLFRQNALPEDKTAESKIDLKDAEHASNEKTTVLVVEEELGDIKREREIQSCEQDCDEKTKNNDQNINAVLPTDSSEDLSKEAINDQSLKATEKPKMKRKPKKITVIPPLPDSTTFSEKVNFLSQHHEKLCQNYLVTKGIKRFSGAWKKAPKDDTLLKARFEVLKEIQQDFNRLCHTCFEESHDLGEDCPLLTPQWIIPNVEGKAL